MKFFMSRKSAEYIRGVLKEKEDTGNKHAKNLRRLLEKQIERNEEAELMDEVGDCASGIDWWKDGH